MLAMWRDREHEYDDDQQQHISTVAELDALLDRLHRQATADHYPHAVIIYPGNRYPDEGHGAGSQWIPANPGDGPQPELCLTVGAEHSPLFWDQPGQPEYLSKGHNGGADHEFEFFYGGQESNAPAWSLVPTADAREAARQFLTSGGTQPPAITWQPAA